MNVKTGIQAVPLWMNKDKRVHGSVFHQKGENVRDSNRL